MRDPLRPLALLLGGFAGRPMRAEALSDGELARPVLRATHLLLPRAFALGRAAVAHASAHLRHSPSDLPIAGLKPMSVALISAIEDARVERLMIREYPGLRGWFLPLLRAAVRRHQLGFEAFVSRLDLALMDPGYEDQSHWVDKARALFEAQAARDLRDYAAFRRIASILANDLGQMRVRFQAQQYVVSAPYRDDNAYLWQYEETAAAQALDIGIDGLPGAGRSECDARVDSSDARRYRYPEWHYKLGLSRTDWCTVIEKSSPVEGRVGSKLPSALNFVSPLRLARGARLRRQLDGEDIDLDAAVEMLVEHRARRVAEPRFFLRPARHKRPLHILILLDLSESANDLAANGRSILAMEKEAALLFARSAAAVGDRVAIHGFSSNTRAEVGYRRMLDFDSPLTDAAALRIHGAAARYSTRTGAALRHAGALLTAQAERGILLLLSDGMPRDIDVHDGRHLVEDARMAVAEIRASGTEVVCVGLDTKLRRELETVFGRKGLRLWSGRGPLSALLRTVYQASAGRVA